VRQSVPTPQLVGQRQAPWAPLPLVIFAPHGYPQSAANKVAPQPLNAPTHGTSRGSLVLPVGIRPNPATNSAFVPWPREPRLIIVVTPTASIVGRESAVIRICLCAKAMTDKKRTGGEQGIALMRLA
jgi:hypothetical protein